MNDLLDYIREVNTTLARACQSATHDDPQNSDASIAIASDLELHALFKIRRFTFVRYLISTNIQDRAFPSDIAEGLNELKPTVEVDEDGGEYRRCKTLLSIPLRWSSWDRGCPDRLGPAGRERGRSRSGARGC